MPIAFASARGTAPPRQFAGTGAFEPIDEQIARFPVCRARMTAAATSSTCNTLPENDSGAPPCVDSYASIGVSVESG
jgi:hypothetical protein